MRAMVMRSVAQGLDGSPLVLEEREAPRATGPFDVVVRIAAAGVCRTDLHLLTGEMDAPLPLILGHENAGFVHDVGPAVTTVAVGDPVICFPFVSDGLSVQERAGLDTDAPGRTTPGITVDGGYAEFMLSNERSMLKVPAGSDLAQLATLTDAGLAAYRACKKAAALVRPGDTVVVLGVGGLGHIAVQAVRAISPGRVVAVDTNPAARA
ncbi:MAG: NAD(P)-dependent alcohol dehydrogenase, partial [Actinobacteria bacterium]|nr:NAD(P)-dependent alcohol dehydrogenase [Actinomycetota bacterium]